MRGEESRRVGKVEMNRIVSVLRTFQQREIQSTLTQASLLLLKKQAEIPEEDSPSVFQRFRQRPKTGTIRLTTDSKNISRARDIESGLANGARYSRPLSSVETVLVIIATALEEAPRHDVFFSSLFLICVRALFVALCLILLYTSTSDRNLSDTIYTTLYSSFYLLSIDTAVAIIVSLVWVVLLRSFVRLLVYLIVLTVPVIVVESGQRVYYKRHSLRGHVLSMFTTEYDLLHTVLYGPLFGTY